MNTTRLLLYLPTMLSCACAHASVSTSTDNGLRHAGVKVEATEVSRTGLGGPGTVAPGRLEFRHGAHLDGILNADSTPLGMWGTTGASQHQAIPQPDRHHHIAPHPPGAVLALVDTAIFSADAPQWSAPQPPANLPSVGENSDIPEPSTCLLLALGMGMVWLKRRRSDAYRWLGHPD